MTENLKVRVAAAVVLGALVGFGSVGTAKAQSKSDEVPGRDLSQVSDYADEGEQLYAMGHYEKAIQEWRRLAAEGSKNAQYRLGVAYNDSVARGTEVVVPRDFEEAAKWYTMAAQGGEPRAQFDLATLYDHGLGVPHSPEKAAQWYLACAERGLEACQYNIATMYEDGVGIEQDLVQAYKWYYVAWSRDFAEFAGPALEALSSELDSAQVKEAITLAKQYEPISD